MCDQLTVRKVETPHTVSIHIGKLSQEKAMDLYGDLPPTQASIGESKASGGSKEKNESIGSSGEQKSCNCTRETNGNFLTNKLFWTPPVWKSTPLMIPSAMKPNVSTTATSSTVVPKKPVSSLSFIPSSAPVKRPSESVATSDATPTTNSVSMTLSIFSTNFF
jgi:hypothetical protein